MNRTAYVDRIALSNFGERFSQDQVMRRVSGKSLDEVDSTTQALFSNSGVSLRRLSLPEFLQQNEQSENQARLARSLVESHTCSAVQNLLDVDQHPEQIDAVVGVTSTTLLLPGVASFVVSTFRGGEISPRALKFDLAGMGCAGAIQGLFVAQSLVMSGQARKVLLVVADAASQAVTALTGTKEDDRSRTLVSALFGDQAVAALITATKSAKEPRPVICEVRTRHVPETEDFAYLDFGPGGDRFPRISKALPGQVGGAALQAVTELLDDELLTLKHIDHWAIHPGGRGVLDKIQEGLELPDFMLTASREVLRDHGNTQAPGCLIALKNVMERDHPGPSYGAYGMLVAMGPGLTIGSALFSWH